MYNPYNYHVAVRDDAMFFGHEKIIQRLVNRLGAPVPLSAAIIGGRRCGKTSLLSKLMRELSKGTQVAGKKRRPILCSLDLQRGRPMACSNDFFLWVLEGLGEAWELEKGLKQGSVVEALQTCYHDEMGRGPVDAFVRAFRSLYTHGVRIRLVILIDEYERILSVEWGDDLRPNLRTLLSSSPITEDVALIVAGSAQMYNQVIDRDSPLENVLDRYLLTTLSHEATLALARQPNGYRLPKEAAEEVWRQTGGQPCMAQYILHELWNQLKGEVGDATKEDVESIAETFDDRTRHCSMWAGTLGQTGNDVYRFLAEQYIPVTYSAIRQHFSQMTSTLLLSTLDALFYHGLVHCHGQGKGRQYKIAGEMFRSWFMEFGLPPLPSPSATYPGDQESKVTLHIDHVGALAVSSRSQSIASGDRSTSIVEEIHMTHNETGTVKATGSIEAESIVTGIQIQGADSEVVQVLTLARQIASGDVTAQDIKAKNIVTGLQYIQDIAQPTRAEFLAELKALRAGLEEAITAGEIQDPEEAQDAKDALERVEKMAQREAPPKEKIVTRLNEVLDFIMEASEVVGKAASVVIKLAPMAAVLIQVAQAVF